MITYDVLVIGGGLAGLMAAKRLQGRVQRVALVNAPVPGTPNELGGFARFSGAKFSLLPAGSGLADVAGGTSELKAAYDAVLDAFAESKIAKFLDHRTHGDERSVGANLQYRQYHSILLEPSEIKALLAFLQASICNVEVLSKSVTKLQISNENPLVHLDDGTTLEAAKLVVAVGRLGAGLLLGAGIPETNGKGLDIGVRVEFDKQSPLRGLRSHGPDAKFLSGTVRTFCLNSPGAIFHYPAFGVQIPGGVVAAPNEQTSNVGILKRLPHKDQARRELKERLSELQGSTQGLVVAGSLDQVCADPHLRSVLSDGVSDDLNAFAQNVQAAGLIDWPAEYRVHYPLIDWHWPVFAKEGTFATHADSVFAVGDLSGHARGLLQAATSGWLCVDEIAL